MFRLSQSYTLKSSIISKSYATYSYNAEFNRKFRLMNSKERDAISKEYDELKKKDWKDLALQEKKNCIYLIYNLSVHYCFRAV